MLLFLSEYLYAQCTDCINSNIVYIFENYCNVYNEPYTISKLRYFKSAVAKVLIIALHGLTQYNKFVFKYISSIRLMRK